MYNISLYIFIKGKQNALVHRIADQIYRESSIIMDITTEICTHYICALFCLNHTNRAEWICELFTHMPQGGFTAACAVVWLPSVSDATVKNRHAIESYLCKSNKELCTWYLRFTVSTYRRNHFKSTHTCINFGFTGPLNKLLWNSEHVPRCRVVQQNALDVKVVIDILLWESFHIILLFKCIENVPSKVF